MSSRGQLGIRLAVLALAAVLLEVDAVSQMPLFGVYADLTPLVAMSVGLMCGSVPGALVGFGMGLYLDLDLDMMLGLSSLVLCLVGYWSGRLGELRAPQGPLVPIAMGAAATAAAEVGYSVGQFLLGNNGPVSFLLLRTILTTILVNALIAAPVHALARRWLSPVLPDAGRRRPRYPSGISPLTGSR